MQTKVSKIGVNANVAATMLCAQCGLTLDVASCIPTVAGSLSAVKLQTKEYFVPYYRKLTLHEIKVLEINAT